MEIKEKEIWGLYWHIAHYIRPRIELFYKNSQGQHPSNITQKEWNRILKKIIKAFTIIENKDNLTEKENEQVQEGLKLFVKWYFDLWL